MCSRLSGNLDAGTSVSIGILNTQVQTTDEIYLNIFQMKTTLTRHSSNVDMSQTLLKFCSEVNKRNQTKADTYSVPHTYHQNIWSSFATVISRHAQCHYQNKDLHNLSQLENIIYTTAFMPS